MRRLRTQNAPYISILSIGIEDADDQTILTLSCGILTEEIRLKFAKIAAIRVTTCTHEFKIEALGKDDAYLGALVRQDLEFASQIKRSLKPRLPRDSEICLRLFAILNPTNYVMKEKCLVLAPSRALDRAA